MAAAPRPAPLDTARRDTIDQLILSYGHGKLSLERFEQRLDRALEAASAEELAALTADLQPIATTELAGRSPPLDVPAVGAAGAAARKTDYMINIFGGSSRTGAWSVPGEIWMLSLFGGGELDFTAARFSSRVTTIKVLCLFGGATIYVPEGINTESKAICIFGSVENSAPSYPDDRPCLMVEGLVLFGGAEIAVKKPLKERLIEFANTLKQMFGPAR